MNRDGTGSMATVVMQHADDAMALRHTRSVLVRSPHVKLLHLARHDERLSAQLDGLMVAGRTGTTLCHERLAEPSRGSVFVATTLAVWRADLVGVMKLLALAEAEVATCRSGLLSALGWVSPSQLRGVSKALLGSDRAFHRGVGWGSCDLHGVAPEATLFASAIHDDDCALRSHALKAAGRLGRVDLLPRCVDALTDEDDTCRLEAARAACRMGERDKALGELKLQAAAGRTHRPAALRELLLALEPHGARVLLKSITTNASDIRLLIRGIGLAGDPHFIPWLLGQMEQPALARLAGESFSLITGVDLADLDLEVLDPPPHNAGPNDDPSDDDVAMDEDDGLPWPDIDKLHAWWKQNASSFPAGTRFFMGQPLNAEHCVDVLKTGRQRQRIVAAHHRSLLAPGTPLFNCAAPAWRQRRALDLG